LAEHCEMLKERGSGKIDIIVDNAGFELVTVSSICILHVLSFTTSSSQLD
jgi:hypothetical protein